MRPLTLVCVTLAAAAACAKPAQKPSQAVRPNWLFDVPYIAQSQLLDTTGTPDAQHVVLLSPRPIDSVAAFYRTKLPQMGWRIVGDVSDTLHVSLFLERGGLPMWIQIEAEGPDSRVFFTATGGGNGPKPAAEQSR
jgi:hypothetical protein